MMNGLVLLLDADAGGSCPFWSAATIAAWFWPAMGPARLDCLEQIGYISQLAACGWAFECAAQRRPDADETRPAVKFCRAGRFLMHRGHGSRMSGPLPDRSG